MLSGHLLDFLDLLKAHRLFDTLRTGRSVGATEAPSQEWLGCTSDESSTGKSKEGDLKVAPTINLTARQFVLV